MLPLRPVILPIRGVANNTAYIDTPSEFAPPDSMRNARPFDTATDRPRLAKRPGLRELVQLPGVTGRVQAVTAVTLSSVITGYRIGSCSQPTDGTSVESIAPAGNFFLLDSAPSTAAMGYMDLTASGTNDGPSSNAIHSVAWHADGERYAVASNYTDSGTSLGVVRISMYHKDTGLIWTQKISDASRSVFNNSIRFAENYLIADVVEKVYILNLTSGATAFSTTLAGWADEIIELAVYASGGFEYIYCLFLGSGRPGTTLEGQIGVIGTSTYQAQHFRSGVYKLRLASDGSIQGEVFGPQLNPALAASGNRHNYYEAAHNYHRISEHTAAYPHGCQPTAMRIGPDGSVFYLRCNKGWGPRPTFTPNLQAAPITVAKIGADGHLEWEMDDNSILETVSFGADGSYQCDIHPPSGPSAYPTLQALAVDANGDLYAAGRANGAGYSCLKIRGADGQVLWRTRLSDPASATTQTVYQAAICIDPTDNNPVVGLHRNALWYSQRTPSVVVAGGASRNAQLLKLDANSGNSVWDFDLGAANAHVYAVAVNQSGEILYGGVKI